ncbi:MAG: SPOR domain-containing protein [Xanthobacteraceae bacterium]|nr:SPOR domain-containing protein [Xanthobacteraceae bacterium]
MEVTTTKGRVGWGLLGGAVACATKFLGQDLYWFRVFIETRETDKLTGMIASYVVLLIILCFVGSVVAAATLETQKFKLLAIAVAAPAMITTYFGGTGGQASKVRLGDFSPISFAHAQEISRADARKDFWEGFLITFGYGKDRSLYRVVVASYKQKGDAEAAAKKFAMKYPDFSFSVAEKRPDNDFYPVIVGEWQLYGDARKLKDFVTTKIGIEDAFLYPYSP